MFISFETENLTAEDRQVLAVLAGDAVATVEPIKAAAAALAERAGVDKPAPAKKAAAAAKKEEPAEGDADGPTLQEAVDRATELVSDGKAKEVKAALKEVGAAKVSELDGPEQIAAWLAEVADD